VVADGLTSEILENEELLNAHGLEKVQGKMGEWKIMNIRTFAH